MHLANTGGIKNYLLNFHKRKENKQAHTRTVLKDISFEIKKGECVGFIGRNGAGKSTLLSLISKVIKPNSGKIFVSERVSSMLELGAGFHPDLTGLENIELYGILMGFSKKAIKEKMNSIVEFSELKEYVHAPIRYYSSGMVARLGFAVISQLNPEIIIVDEVLAVGDFKFRSKCKTIFENFKEQNKTIILVSHSGSDIISFCTRAIWLDNGEMRFDGNPQEAMKAYESHYNVCGKND